MTNFNPPERIKMNAAKLYTALLTIGCLHLEPAHANCSLSGSPEKILLVQVDEIGMIKIGRDTLGSDQLARYIQERLFKSYMGTGQMHDRIRLEKTDPQVPAPVMEVIIHEIKEGQRRALSELCVQRYRKSYEELDKKKKDKLKKQFPVLFQQTFY